MSERKVYDISSIGDEIPFVQFGANKDLLVGQIDQRWLRDELDKAGALVYYEEIVGGHNTFLLANNMSYFDKVIELVD